MKIFTSYKGEKATHLSIGFYTEHKTMADKEESLAAAVNLLTLLASESGKETFFLPTLDGASSSSTS